MLAADAVLNFADALSYFYRGNASILAYYMVRGTKFFVIVSGFVVLAFSAIHVYRVVITRGGRVHALLAACFCCPRAFVAMDYRCDMEGVRPAGMWLAKNLF